MKWIPVEIQLPPDDEVVETKLINPIRNVQYLKRKRNLWWQPDGSMYVYYSPTHWRKIIHKDI